MLTNSFSKTLYKSGLSNHFYMHVPTSFSEDHLPRRDVTVVLVKGSGKEYKVAYSVKQSRFQRGWREFAIAHDLQVGDILVFHQIDTCKFKVQITRAGKSTVNKRRNDKSEDVEHALALVPHALVSREDFDKMDAKMDAGLKEVLDIVKRLEMQFDNSRSRFSSDKKRNEKLKDIEKEPKRLENNVFNDKMAGVKISFARKRKQREKMVPAQTKNVCIRTGSKETIDAEDDSSLNVSGSDDTQTNSSLGIEKSEPALNFETVKGFKDFKIRVNGETLDSEIPADMRRKYYQLCYGQNKFLHDCVSKSLDSKFVVAMIHEIIRIADSIKTSSISTPLHHLEGMDTSLKSFQDLGMTVTSLRFKIDELIQISSEHETIEESKKLELAELESKMNDYEEKKAKFEELIANIKTDGVFIKYREENIDTLQQKREKLRDTFKKVAGST